MGVASPSTQRLVLKIEEDKTPPAGARCETTALTGAQLIAIRHYDIWAMLAKG